MLDLSGFYTLEATVVPLNTFVDFNKPASEPPRAVSVLLDWRVQDARYNAIRPASSDPYAINFDLTRADQTFVPPAEVKSIVIDNINNPLPVLVECFDSGYQIFVDAGEYRQSMLLTSKYQFKVWTVYGSAVGAAVPINTTRKTLIFFNNFPIPPFQTKQKASRSIVFSASDALTIPARSVSSQPNAWHDNNALTLLDFRLPVGGRLTNLTVSFGKRAGSSSMSYQSSDIILPTCRLYMESNGVQTDIVSQVFSFNTEANTLTQAPFLDKALSIDIPADAKFYYEYKSKARYLTGSAGTGTFGEVLRSVFLTAESYL